MDGWILFYLPNDTFNVLNGVEEEGNYELSIWKGRVVI
jgi:hypothetical protein